MATKNIVTNDYVVTYDNVTCVLVNLNAGIRMLEEGYAKEGLAAIKRAKEQLRDYRGAKRRASDITDAYINYLRLVAASASADQI